MGTSPDYADKSRFGDAIRSTERALASVMYFVVYAPFVLLSYPFFLFSDDKQNAEQARIYIEDRSRFLESIELGQRIESFGGFRASLIFYAGDIRIHEFDGDYALGLENGQVVIIESPSVREVYERTAAYGQPRTRVDCSEMTNYNSRAEERS